MCVLGAILEKQDDQASDLELVRKAGTGDSLAFEEIVRRHSPRVFRVASHFFRQREKVEEAAQEVFLKAYTEPSSFQGRGSLEGWLSRMTTHICLNLIRGARRRRESTAADLTEQEMEWFEQQSSDASDPRYHSIERRLVTADLAEKLLRELSPEDRAVLTLIDGNDLSVKEVVDLTGWSESKVKVRAMRARRQMRKAVEKWLGPGRGTGSAGET